MRRGAALALGGVLLLCGCAKRAPASSVSAGPPGWFTAAFHAVGSGPQGRIRLRGLLAVSGADALRVEIPGPTGGSGFFLIADASEVVALLAPERLYYRGSAEAPILRELLGLDLDTRQVSRLLGGREAGLGDACAPSRRRWTVLPGGARIPSKIRIDCGATRLKLRLREIGPLTEARAHAAFDPIPLPDGYRQTDMQGLARALRAVAAGSS